MEFRQLSYFLAAAQTENFRRAAELCLVAQSALSRQIAALENELGVSLFRRSEQRVTLTEAGHEFALYARNALDQLQKGQQAMVELTTGERGTISLGCVEALATTYLPSVFASFHRRYPSIGLQVSVGGADDLMHLVEGGKLEFGLIFDPPRHSELLSVHELFRQPIQVITPLDHPLARRNEPVRLEQLRYEPLVTLSRGYGLRRIIEEVFARRGWTLQPSVEIGSIEALKEFVKEGVGVSFMPMALLRPDQPGRELAVLPCADLSDEFSFALIYRRFGTLSMAARGLIEAISQDTAVRQ